MTILAEDPGVVRGDRQVTLAEVEIPAEELKPGPCGHRVYVVDYDASTGDMYVPVDFDELYRDGDPFRDVDFDRVVSDRAFHAVNAYAIVMRTLARFEFALGRRVGWQIVGHQLKVVPHAFEDANAFYSPSAEALLFGYFPDAQGTMIFSCLSHDVVAHETTHALVDGLRSRFTDPSGPDQAAFHEGFADVVALLSVFSLPEVTKAVIDYRFDPERLPNGETMRVPPEYVRAEDVEPDALKHSVLMGLAHQMGTALSRTRGQALRQSATLARKGGYLEQAAYLEPHRRGEVFAAAMLDAFVRIWDARIKRLHMVNDQTLGGLYSRDAVVDEGAEVADYLLTMAIRALDYTPPIHLTFDEYVSALLTADARVRPNEGRHRFRELIKESFEGYGVVCKPRYTTTDGFWLPVEGEFGYDRTRFDAMQHARDEVFRFVWENLDRLGLNRDAYTEVESVRQAMRIAPEDGFPVTETIVETIQLMEADAHELRHFGIEKPRDMPDSTHVVLRGGATLIFNDFGRLLYRIPNALPKPVDEQTGDDERIARLFEDRLKHLWEHGYFEPPTDPTDASGGPAGPWRMRYRDKRFREIHLNRALDLGTDTREVW
jgi:hypothetical protein